MKLTDFVNPASILPDLKVASKEAAIRAMVESLVNAAAIRRDDQESIVAAILMSILGIRMWFLQSVKLELNEDIVLSVRTRTIRLLPERGRIFDAKGRIVADTSVEDAIDDLADDLVDEVD